MRLEQHHQFDDDRTDLLAHAASMAFDEILLQGAQFVGRDAFAAQGAEAGGDPVERFGGFGGFLIQIVAAFLYAFFGFGSTADRQIGISSVR